MENQMEKLPELGLNSGPQLRALSPGQNHYTHTHTHYTHTHTHKREYGKNIEETLLSLHCIGTHDFGGVLMMTRITD